jgi:hypothetical protein
MSKKVLLIVGVVVVILIAGGIIFYVQFANQQKEEETQTTSTSETTTEPPTPKTEVRVKGQNATLVIAPSVDNVISGTVTVTVEQAPSETKFTFFIIAESGVKPEGPNLGIDEDGSDGWSRLLDTTKYKNGVYEIAGLPTTTSEGNPLGRAAAQVEIKN